MMFGGRANWCDEVDAYVAIILEVEIDPAHPVSKVKPDYWDGRKRAYEH